MIDLSAGGYKISARFGAAFEADNLGGDMLGLGISLTRANLSVSGRTLDFTTGSLPAGVTFTRAGGGGRVNSSGLYEWVGADVPRFDYDPITLACKGLLIEESRTNFLPYYSDVSSADWSKVGTSVVPSATAGLDGDLSASKIVEDTSVGAHMVSDGCSFTAGTSYVVKVVAKAAERTFLQIVLTSSAFGSNQIAAFDLVNGLSSFSGSAGVRAGMRQVGFGFYECFLVVTATATAISSVQIRTSTTYSAASPASYAGNGVSGVYLWAAQVEAGMFDTSIVQTTGSPATRAADQPRITANLGTRDVRVTTEAGVQVLTGQALTGSYWPALTGPQRIRKIEVL